MKIRNNTKFPCETFEQYSLDGELHSVLAVRGTFEIDCQSNFAPIVASDQQTVFLWEDRYAMLNNGARLLIEPSDFLAFKPRTDFTVLARSYPPDNRAARSWTTGVRIGRDNIKVLRVYGPRYWEPINAIEEQAETSSHSSFKGWHLTEAQPVGSLEVSWTLAYGGIYPRGPEDLQQVYPKNPVGRGILKEGFSERDRSFPAPQIEFEQDPITDWRKEYEPAGFAPVAPSWNWRQRHAGTYDEAWKETRHPLLPRDFDYRFWQCAPPDQIVPSWLKGDEEIVFAQLHRTYPLIRCKLPDIRLYCKIRRALGKLETYDLVLDGVHANLLAHQPTISLTWRVNFKVAEGVKELELTASNDAFGTGATT